MGLIKSCLVADVSVAGSLILLFGGGSVTGDRSRSCPSAWINQFIYVNMRMQIFKWGHCARFSFYLNKLLSSPLSFDVNRERERVYS